MQSAKPNPRPPASATDVYVRDLSTGRTFRVNPPGTHAETGGFSGDFFVFQLERGGNSDLMYIAAWERHPRPFPVAGVNTRDWEWKPSVSGPLILFGRINAAGTYRVILGPAPGTTLAKVSGHGAYAAPGQVNGHYAVWMSCPDNLCRVYRYDVFTRKTIRMPPPPNYDDWQTGPSVARDGTVYYGLASRECTNVRLVRYRRGRLSVLVRFRRGLAFNYSYAYGGSVYYDRTGCARDATSDIYRYDER